MERKIEEKTSRAMELVYNFAIETFEKHDVDGWDSLESVIPLNAVILSHVAKQSQTRQDWDTNKRCAQETFETLLNRVFSPVKGLQLPFVQNKEVNQKIQETVESMKEVIEASRLGGEAIILLLREILGMVTVREMGLQEEKNRDILQNFISDHISKDVLEGVEYFKQSQRDLAIASKNVDLF